MQQQSRRVSWEAAKNAASNSNKGSQCGRAACARHSTFWTGPIAGGVRLRTRRQQKVAAKVVARVVAQLAARPTKPFGGRERRRRSRTSGARGHGRRVRRRRPQTRAMQIARKLQEARLQHASHRQAQDIQLKPNPTSEHNAQTVDDAARRSRRDQFLSRRGKRQEVRPRGFLTVHYAILAQVQAGEERPVKAKCSEMRGRRRTCNRTLNTRGDHLTSCTRIGFVELRPTPLERAWAQVSREGGARVVENQ